MGQLFLEIKRTRSSNEKYTFPMSIKLLSFYHFIQRELKWAGAALQINNFVKSLHSEHSIKIHFARVWCVNVLRIWRITTWAWSYNFFWMVSLIWYWLLPPLQYEEHISINVFSVNVSNKCENCEPAWLKEICV